MPVERLLPTEEAADLIVLARNVADKVLTPIVDGHEKAETYPEGVFAQLGAAGLLSLPQPEEWSGGVRRKCVLCSGYFYEQPMNRSVVRRRPYSSRG